MNKSILAVVFAVLSLQLMAQKPIKQTVISHNQLTIVTDPSKGIHPYKRWAVFPDKAKSVRKIVMKVTLGSPDSLPTAHWDYLDHIRIRRVGGLNGASLDYELGRMLTPYGSIFGKGWSWEWRSDVTDFAPILRDSIEVEYNHSGYEPATVGWKLTVAFEITFGPEIMHQLGFAKVWDGNFKYGDPDTTIEMQLKPFRFTTDQTVAITRFRIQHTGHGMDQPKGCSEFCSRWRQVYLDGTMMNHTDLWKNCGDNPLYPQGGTWIYDRAWWCPGNLQPADIIDMYTAPGKHEISLKMEPYTATDSKGATESIASYIAYYQKPNAKNDASIEEILVPNNHPAFNRMNPAGSSAVIQIKNNGSEPLTSLTIEYGTDGFKPAQYEWKGKLAFNQVATVNLPGMLQYSAKKSTFTVTLKKPNGRTDAWTGDNTLQSSFDAPPVQPTAMLLQFRTNNKPSENDLVLRDVKGNVVFQKSGKNLKPATIYTDTLQLIPSVYTLTLSDSAGDGLEFWYEPESGYGFLRMLDLSGRLIHNFESDNGDGIHYCFEAKDNVPIDTSLTNYSFVLFPRMAKEQIALDVHSDKASKMEVVITSDGVPVEKHFYANVKQSNFNFTLNHLKPGRYIIEVWMDGISQYKRRFNKI
jgi:hypothetical protein